MSTPAPRGVGDPVVDGRDSAHDAEIRRLLAFCDRAAWWLDDCLRLPGTGFRFGLDAIVGLIPLAGDGLALLVSVLTVYRAREAGVPNALLGKMLKNVVIDFFGSLLPVFGDLFDAVFKAHRRNFELLRREYGERLAPAPRRSRAPRLVGAALLVLLAWAVWRWLH